MSLEDAQKALLIAACLIFGITSQTHAAPKTIADETSNPAKVAKMVWFGPPPGQIKQLYNIGLPKRIGLISFIINDTGTNKFSALAATYGGVYSRSWYMGDYNANIFASAFAEQGLPIIRERFAEKGMLVLTPDEFLDTEEKNSIYRDFEISESGLQKATLAVQDWINRNPNSAAQADGYNWIPMYASLLGQGVMGQLDELRKALDLDALMVVTTNTRTDSQYTYLSGVYMQLIGPNPEPRPENEKHLKYWWPMVVYPSATFGKGFKGAMFHRWESRDQEAWTNYDGYDVIVDAMSVRTLAELQKHYDKGAKKAK